MAEPGMTTEAATAEEQNFSDWMSALPPRLSSEPLKNIAIPGSHNSFSYCIDTRSNVAPGTPDTIRNLVSVFGGGAKDIVHKWSVTQSLTFKQQLDSGIRYFDLRLSTCDGTNEIFFVHGLYAGKVMDGLTEINEWLVNHPKEMVILDFNHLYKMTEYHHTQLLQQFFQLFNGKICPCVDLESCTLNMLWENKWQVIAIYHNEVVMKNPRIWPANMIVSVWPNTAEAPKMVNLLEAHHTRGRDPNKFHVTQGVLTPNGTTILGNIARDLKSVCAPVATRNLQFYLKNKKIGAKGVNIVIADFIEMCEFVPTVLSLNT
ncbi:PI-PLC X domain-containing protein 3-like [Glandiceps talaboti]